MQTEENLKGVASKPEECKLCPLYYKGSGFVQDEYNDESRILLVQNHPNKGDLLTRVPMSIMQSFAEKRLWHPLNLERKDFSFAYILRCYPEGKYPTGHCKKVGERTCRQYDKYVIKKFDPTLFIATFSLRDVLETPSFTTLLQSSFRKAKKMGETDKVALLMGQEALDLVNPYLGKGGVKAWQGHFWKGKWEW